MYNQHQAGPAGSVLFFSPFGIHSTTIKTRWFPRHRLVSAAVHERFLAEGKPSAVMRCNAIFHLSTRRPYHRSFTARAACRDYRQSSPIIFR